MELQTEGMDEPSDLPEGLDNPSEPSEELDNPSEPSEALDKPSNSSEKNGQAKQFIGKNGQAKRRDTWLLSCFASAGLSSISSSAPIFATKRRNFVSMLSRLG
ncbi:hypothetical protein [Paenibacillus sp. P22]|uniref:hypothetical protein n=1 Tax=Paenibacillus sp. P22 TaxID=483908 RepID=UPI00038F7EA1|nr:hypothetical protein [Paenibacillus sp. P22]CDN43941.1 hypothetical protein BN871_DW_00070 [Paenibacillus sp. P22]